ncbi:hypothetical protein CR513_52760, partial [Mucuna pruriens]
MTKGRLRKLQEEAHRRMSLLIGLGLKAHLEMGLVIDVYLEQRQIELYQQRHYTTRIKKPFLLVIEDRKFHHQRMSSDLENHKDQLRCTTITSKACGGKLIFDD